MTRQASDYMWYNGKKYTLIDCEKDKNIINSGNFNLDLSERAFSTACRRGYQAEYFVENYLLFGIKSVDLNVLKIGENSAVFRTLTSQKIRLNYTGSVIIAINNSNRIGFSDFLTDYLDYDQAFELYFIDGELSEITDLKSAIDKWNETQKKFISKTNFDEQYSIKEQIAESNLQYEYGFSYIYMEDIQ